MPDHLDSPELQAFARYLLTLPDPEWKEALLSAKALAYATRVVRQRPDFLEQFRLMNHQLPPGFLETIEISPVETLHCQSPEELLPSTM